MRRLDMKNRIFVSFWNIKAPTDTKNQMKIKQMSLFFFAFSFVLCICTMKWTSLNGNSGIKWGNERMKIKHFAKNVFFFFFFSFLSHKIYIKDMWKRIWKCQIINHDNKKVNNGKHIWNMLKTRWAKWKIEHVYIHFYIIIFSFILFRSLLLFTYFSFSVLFVCHFLNPLVNTVNCYKL